MLDARTVFLLLPLLLADLGCRSTQVVRLQPEAIAAGPGLRPIAGIQADAISAYALFLGIPGGVDLDRVVNQMLVVAAKTMGADKIANLHFESTPTDGLWALRRLIGWRSAHATGIAVQITSVAADPNADSGPEPGLAPPGVTMSRGGGRAAH